MCEKRSPGADLGGFGGQGPPGPKRDPEKIPKAWILVPFRKQNPSRQQSFFGLVFRRRFLVISALSRDQFRSILPPKTILKANKREQQKPSFYTIKVMVSRGRRPQVRPKTDQKGQPGKETISGTFFYDFCLFWKLLFDSKIALKSSRKLRPKQKRQERFSEICVPGTPPRPT